MSMSVRPTQRAPTDRLVAIASRGLPCAGAGWCGAQRFRSRAGHKNLCFTSGAAQLWDQGREPRVLLPASRCSLPRIRFEWRDLL